MIKDKGKTRHNKFYKPDERTELDNSKNSTNAMDPTTLWHNDLIMSGKAG